MSFRILPYAPRKSKEKPMFINCFCGRCSQCRHRAANRKYYAVRRVDQGPETERWSRIYDLKFKDSTYYDPIVHGPQSSLPAFVDLLIGRGRAGRVPRRPHCK